MCLLLRLAEGPTETCGCVMSSHIKVAGVWRDVQTMHVKVSGVWKQVSDAWLKVGGVWKQVYTALTAELNSSSYFGTGFSPGFASVYPSVIVEGTGPFTYVWTVTGVYSLLINETTADLTIRLGTAPEYQTGTVYCTVTDALGNSVATPTSTWELEVV